MAYMATAMVVVTLVAVFNAYNQKYFQIWNKEQVKEQQQLI